ncbi:MAG: lectin-like domain-containing protein [Cytophagaceae bacterium]
MIKSLLSYAIYSFLFLSVVSPSFGQGKFQLNGEATAISGVENYRLTPAQNSKFGSIWHRKMSDLSKDFEIKAWMYFGTNTGGADGITFSFQNQCTSVGSIGGSIGMGGVNPSLIVEFDTYRNSDFGDPVADHIGILKNGNASHNTHGLAGPVSMQANNNHVKTGWEWEVTIKWTASTKKLTVFFAGVERLTYTGDIVNEIFGGNPYVYWGFTASTGGLNNDHRVRIENFPTNEVKLNDGIICQGDTLQPILPGGTSYTWTPNTHISNSTVYNPKLYPPVDTKYIVEIKDACNNTQKDSIFVTVKPLPVISLSDFAPVCNNVSAFALTGGTPAGGSYSGTGVNNGEFNPATAGTGSHNITYTITGENGCQNKATKAIEVKQTTDASLSDLGPICINAPELTLAGGSPSGGVYSGTGVSDGKFNPATAGIGNHTITYKYTNTDNCVSEASKSIMVNGKPNPTISAPEGSVICSGNAITLSAGSASTIKYEWIKDNSSVSTLDAANNQFTATAGGSYKVRAVDNNGCEETSSELIVTTGTSPTADINSNATEFCPGDQITLTTSKQDGESVKWLRNNVEIAGESGLTYSTGIAGAYTVEITAADGCKTRSSAITLTQKAAAVATLSSAAPAFCPGANSITLTANNVSNATYTWYKDDQEITIPNASQYSATATGSYKVKVTLENGCHKTSDAVVLVTGTAPTASISSSANAFCQGSSLAITAEAVSGATYNWFRGGVKVAGPSSSNTYNTNEGGEIYAQVISNLGCSANSNSLNITKNALPAASISAPLTTICSGSSVTISANVISGATYEWFRNNNSLGTPTVDANTHAASIAGTYKVRINNGCVNSSNEITLNVSNAPSAAGSISGSTSFCAGADGNTYSIPAVTGATNYVWEISPANKATIKSGQGTRTITVDFTNSSVTLKVTPKNACGEGASSSQSITLETGFMCSTGQVSFAAYPTNTCQGSTVTFYNYTSNPPMNATLKWNFGAGANPATGTGNGPHNVTYSSSGNKTVIAEYIDNFGNFPVASTTKTDYIVISGSVNTSVITGPSNITDCSGSETYSVTNTTGSSYNWTATGGASILSGNGTNSVVVKFNNSASTISVTETNSSGCVGTAKTINVSCPTGIADASLNALKVYPNPSSGIVNLDISFEKAESFRLKVYDMNGQLVFSKEGMVSGDYNEQVDLSDLSKGLYSVNLITDSKKISKTFMLK